MRHKFVAGNWKMNGGLSANDTLLSSLLAQSARYSGVDVVVFAPFPYLAQLDQKLSQSVIGFGAQNVSQHPSGAYTGEVSAQMLLDFGCAYVLVGHSERRALFGETDEIVASKFLAAFKAGLKPVLCVGETLQERDAGLANDTVARQLCAIIDLCGVSVFEKAIIAYEPVWAIGTGKTATSEQAQEVHKHIRGVVATFDAAIANNVRIIYGGSVKSSNAAELFSMPDIDGGLVGGASLVAEDFIDICSAAV